ncbi:mechanosensitive ion channel [Parvibaculaceae bacterium PLY_AMNH_Bact1]|nr:mechanosensitive ion channel [Parvibaculaceae bacterium PLY_AMNH_Bact1]
MDSSVLLDKFEKLLASTETWVHLHIFTWSAATQAALFAIAAIVAYLVHRHFAPHVNRLAGQGQVLTKSAEKLQPLIFPLTAALLVWTGFAAMAQAEQPTEMLRVAGNLLAAWVVIRLLSSFLRQSTWTPAIATIVWIVAALAILGWLDPLRGLLDAAAFQAGDLRVSALGLINGILLLAAFLILSQVLVRLTDDRMRAMSGVTPAARVLLVKLLRIVFITLAVVVALTSVGIDLSAVAIFSGAVGIGVGFGLQKVISNLFSGILLLLDRSLKPGDVIEVGDAYGWIDKMGARYITVATRDGKEYLIPNEDIITQQVINWSHSNKAVRIKIGLGISYGSDVRKAMELMVQAAGDHTRVLKDPEHDPQVRLTEFADSSVNLELRVWVLDPEKGMVNIASDIRLAIWDLFHEEGIEFPFPQHDVHVASASGLEAVLEKYLKDR